MPVVRGGLCDLGGLVMAAPNGPTSGTLTGVPHRCCATIACDLTTLVVHSPDPPRPHLLLLRRIVFSHVMYVLHLPLPYPHIPPDLLLLLQLSACMMLVLPPTGPCSASFFVTTDSNFFAAPNKEYSLHITSSRTTRLTPSPCVPTRPCSMPP